MRVGRQVGRALCAFGICVAVAQPMPTHAQAPLDKAYRLLDEGSFEDALSQLGHAEEGSLSRQELIRLLQARAMCHLALRDEASLTQTLSQLAAVAPDHTFAEQLPPDLSEGFDRVRQRSPGSVELRVDVTVQETTITFEGSVLHPIDLPLRYRLHARQPAGQWHSSTDEPLVVPVPLEGGLQYYGTLHGPGDALIDEVGSVDHPEVFIRNGEPTTDEDDSADDGPPWGTILGVGGGVVVATVLVVLIVALSGEGGTQPSRPIVP